MGTYIFKILTGEILVGELEKITSGLTDNSKKYIFKEVYVFIPNQKLQLLPFGKPFFSNEEMEFLDEHIILIQKASDDVEKQYKEAKLGLESPQKLFS